MSNFDPLSSKYKKKADVVDDRSTPEARAARVKRVRNLANLSRKEMCDDNELNPNTLKGWEIARYGGLPLDGAHKIVKRVAREGVSCSVEWLLYEDGAPPSVRVGQTLPSQKEASTFSEENNIEKECILFQKHHPDALHFQINDDGMQPFYEEGDIVAGIKKTGKQMDELIDTHCIVQLTSGELLCRKLRKRKLNGTYHLVCVNTETNVELPIISGVELLAAARIIWHRKNVESCLKNTKIAAKNILQKTAHDIRSPAAALQVLLTNTKNLDKNHEEILRNILTSLNNIADDLTQKG